MAPLTVLFIVVVVLVTSTLSGVFGMAGGLLLMGGLAIFMPVSAAFVTHGVVQMIGNGWRVVLHRRHVQWPIVGFYAVGSVAIAAVLAFVAYAPSKPMLFLLLGLVSMLAWTPRGALSLDAAKPAHGIVAGLGVTGLNLIAGVSGPLLDVFFVRTGLTRHRIVATKAATQVLAHGFKILIYGIPLIRAGSDTLPPIWLFALTAPMSVIGTVLGGRILDRMTDVHFIAWTRWIITVIGLVYLVRATLLFAGGTGS